MTGAGMEIDPCSVANQDQINSLAAALLMRIMIQSQQILGGTLSFGTPQLIQATCPNLTLQFSIPFTFMNFLSLSGTLRVSARVTARIMGNQTLLCLRELRAVGLSLPTAPGIEGVAAGAVAQLLPSDICIDVTGIVGSLGLCI